MPKRLDAYDGQLNAIVDGIIDGRVVPFLGAGVNLCGRPRDVHWQPGGHQYLPSGEELATYLARTTGYTRPDSGDLLRVSQYVAVMSGAGPLYDKLHGVFNHDFPPTAVHGLLTRLPQLLARKGLPPRCFLIVTTNYDDLMERTLRDAGQPFDLISYVADGANRGKFQHQLPSGETVTIDTPNEYLGVGVEPRTVVMKIHGTIDRRAEDRDSYVITEDDYIAYLTKTELSNLVPVKLAAKLKSSHFLFLGYGLRDWNLRVILHRISEDQPRKYNSWAIQLGPDELDRKFWDRRSVDILDISLEACVETLEQRLEPFPAPGTETQ